MTSCRLLSDFGTNIMGEAAGDIDLQTMPAFIALSRYTFSTLSSAEDVRSMTAFRHCLLSSAR